MSGRPLEEIAAFQWDSANRIVLDDLTALPRERWTSLSYEALLADPCGSIDRLCSFLGVEPDASLQQRLAAPLPPSRYTLTAPATDKWRRHEAAIQRVLPALQATWSRLEGLGR